MKMPITKIKYKMEFSKKIFVCISLATVIIVVFSLYMMWITKDLTPLMYLIPAMFAELATSTGFYYSKSKAENLIKIEKGFEQDNNKGDI